MRIKLLFQFIFILSCLSVSAQDLTFSGKLVFDAEMQQKPSALAGHSNFILNQAELGLLKSFDPDLDAKIQARYLYNYDQNLPAYVTQIAEARVRLQKAFAESDHIEVGLVRHPWGLLEDKSWDYNFVYMNGRGLSTRYNYIPRSDAGINYRYAWGQESAVHVSLTNGEGSSVAETGAKKDLALVADWSGSNWWMAAGYVYGGYENLADDMSKKTRELFLMRWQASPLIVMQLELMRATDPVDAINKLLADSVDLTPQGGMTATAEAASMGIQYLCHVESPWTLLLQGHWLNPMKEVPSKWVRSAWLGLAHQTREKLQTLISFQSTSYGSDHAAAIRDRESFVFTAALNF